MVRQCYVCKKLDHLNPDISFHKFPTNVERRKIWFSLLGWDENQHLPKNLHICSNHFASGDIITKANGFRYIKPDTNPLPCHSAFIIPSDSSDSTLYDTPKRLETKGIQDICFDDILIASPVKDTPSSKSGPELEPVEGKNMIVSEIASSSLVTTGALGAELEVLVLSGSEAKLNIEECKDKSESDIPSSSVTATASEAEHEILQLRAVKQKSSNITSRKRKRRYIGDMSSSDFATPEKRRKNLAIVKETDAMRRKKIHTLQTTVKRLRLRITSLKSLLAYLKEKCLISEASEATISASIPGTAGDIFKRMLKGPTKQKFVPSLRCFALTLSFYSPKAYNFVRKTFNRSLPHLGTISKWYRSIDGSPGFTNEALIALKMKQEDSSTPLLCNLVMDEMSIRQQIEWTGQKFTGYVDIGTNLDSDTLPEARESLVLMLVCINGSWKVPVGYFLVDGLTATDKAGLVKKCLEFINDSGVVVTSLTFDGAPSNISMAEKLGADFSDPMNLKTSFKHPITNSDIYIYLDACHMIKLVRNCFGSQTGLKDIKKKGNKMELCLKFS